MSEFQDVQETEESYTDSLQFDYGERNESEELQEYFTDKQEDLTDKTESVSDSSELARKISELQYENEQAELSFEMSKSKAERSYWSKRCDEIRNEKDRIIYESQQLRTKK